MVSNLATSATPGQARQFLVRELGCDRFRVVQHQGSEPADRRLVLGAVKGLAFQQAVGMVRRLASPLAAEPMSPPAVPTGSSSCGCGAAVGSTMARGRWV